MTARSSEPLWQMPATELAAAYGAGHTTPSQVLRSTLDRLDDVNPRVNAVVTLDAAGALAAARASTLRWQRGEPLGPLDGVTVTIKDNLLVAGLVSTWGSKLYAGLVPQADEQPVARLRAAGAVIIGKTNVPEFTLHGNTDNALFGPTRNPWNLALTPGGSSGGAVAAVASGIGAIALATDGGGSIRRPAAHTGLVGFKPSRGMVPRGSGFPVILHDFEVAGPIARTVDDIALAMSVLGGAQWRGDIEPDTATFVPRRILHARTFGNAPVDPAIASAVAGIAADLMQQGHDVVTIDSFDLAAAIEDVWPVISQAGLAWLIATQPNGADLIGTPLAEMAERGRAFSATDYVAALRRIDDVDALFDGLFGDFDFLLTPATAAMPWPARDVYPTVIDGIAVGPRGHAVFTPFANALGLPAISLPCPVAAGRLPIGFQLVAARGGDFGLVQFARRLMAGRASPQGWPLLDAGE